MTPLAGIPFVAAPDSARAVATVYTASLLATVPMAIAVAAGFVLRGSSAQARMLVWRSAVGALALMLIGRLAPLHWVAFAVPSMLAAPLVALGRVQVTSGPSSAIPVAPAVSGVLVAYVFVGLIVVAPMLIGALRVVRTIRRGSPVRDPGWITAMSRARERLHVRRPVRLVYAPDASVPMTWGVFTPVVVLPPDAGTWNADQREMVLLHELAHVAGADWLFKILARLVCAAFWFHPGAWWIARRQHDDGELSCDERVLASGVRRSDYAELLVDAASRFLTMEPAVALVRQDGIRRRLAAILHARVARPLARGWIPAAALCAAAVAGPMSVIQLAPSRAVLDSLMTDTRWESRAYAVIGLASRADSLAVARRIAERDPSPRVRAWARYALGQSTVSTARHILSHH